MNPIKNIMAQFVAGAFLIILCLGALIFSQQQANQIQNQLRIWQNHAGALELNLATLQQQAQHYKLNAPRDFESYNRDVAVFYKQFQQLLNIISASNDLADKASSDLLDQSMGSFLLNDQPALNTALAEQASWLAFWQTFLNNLNSEIGSASEPRLEWAAEHIINTQGNVNQRTQKLYKSIAGANDNLEQHFQQLSWGISLGVLAFIAALLALFAHFVVRPIVSTTKVCEAVASGDYGQKVNATGVGEVKQLQIAFNDVSSRSKLLMDMLADINKPGDVPTKLQRIFNSGKEPLGCSWIGLMAFNESRAELNSSVPAALDANFKHRHVTLNKTFGRELLKAVETQWLDLSGLRQLSVQRHDERFLRELHKNTMAQHIVGYSFKCPQHSEFILMFACNLEQGFTEQQIDIIKALSKLMADGIIAGLDYKQAA